MPTQPTITTDAATQCEALDRMIGERIRLWRKSAGLRQRDIANTLGITHQQLSKYEQGVNRISAGTLCYLAHSYNLPLETLTGYEEARQQSSNAGLIQRMSYHFANIQNEDKQALLCNLAEALSQQTSTDDKKLSPWPSRA